MRLAAHSEGKMPSPPEARRRSEPPSTAPMPFLRHRLPRCSQGISDQVSQRGLPPTEKARTLFRLPPKGGVICVTRAFTTDITPPFGGESKKGVLAFFRWGVGRAKRLDQSLPNDLRTNAPCGACEGKMPSPPRARCWPNRSQAPRAGFRLPPKGGVVCVTRAFTTDITPPLGGSRKKASSPFFGGG